MVQAYVLSIAIKSLMYYVAHWDVFQTELLNDVFDLYFRGICLLYLTNRQVLLRNQFNFMSFISNVICHYN